MLGFKKFSCARTLLIGIKLMHMIKKGQMKHRSLGVRWYCKYGISYRELEEMTEERGVMLDHTTAYRWVQRYAPEVEMPVCPVSIELLYAFLKSVEETGFYAALGDMYGPVRASST